MRIFWLSVLCVLSGGAFASPLAAQDTDRPDTFYLCLSHSPDGVTPVYVGPRPTMTYHIDPESGFIRYQRSIQIRAGQEYCTYYESKEKADIHLVHRLYLDEKPWTLMSWEGVNPISKPSPITDLDYRSAIIRKIKGQESARDVKPAAKPPAPGVLIIEDNGVTARTKAWDNHLLQVQRASAALKLAKAAATAESKAEYDRIMARYFAEQKKRGNKQ